MKKSSRALLVDLLFLGIVLTAAAVIASPSEPGAPSRLRDPTGARQRQVIFDLDADDHSVLPIMRQLWAEEEANYQFSEDSDEIRG